MSFNRVRGNSAARQRSLLERFYRCIRLFLLREYYNGVRQRRQNPRGFGW